jgi:thiopurine S-methyltransferase
MDEAFWNDRWARGQIGFHEGAPNRFLLRFIERLGGVPGRVLVPLCGKSRDLDVLCERGGSVVGCELIERAVDEYFLEHEENPLRDREGDFERYRSPGRSVTIVRGDALAYDSPEGPFDAAYDRAALIALPAEVRARYVERLARSVRPGGRVLLVTLEHDRGSGPPFSVSRAQVDELFSGSFAVEELASEDITEGSPRMTEAGASRVIERALLLTRFR